ncbi:MAG: hypothetical protein HY815_05155 [Candidatus Riflebacteria bacterium]|nr:hypothetical protein [Candidatus Riflebacteria bacterium]
MADGILSLQELERSRRQHIRELKLIERMTDEQFEIFKKNFSLGVCDPKIRRREAIEVLKSMILTNLSLQRQKETQSG